MSRRLFLSWLVSFCGLDTLELGQFCARDFVRSTFWLPPSFSQSFSLHFFIFSAFEELSLLLSISKEIVCFAFVVVKWRVSQQIRDLARVSCAQTLISAGEPPAYTEERFHRSPSMFLVHWKEEFTIFERRLYSFLLQKCACNLIVTLG